MKDVISREDMLKALGQGAPQESAESTPILTLKGIAADRNAQRECRAARQLRPRRGDHDDEPRS